MIRRIGRRKRRRKTLGGEKNTSPFKRNPVEKKTFSLVSGKRSVDPVRGRPLIEILYEYGIDPFRHNQIEEDRSLFF